MSGLKPSIRAVVVALRKESVDRNRVAVDRGRKDANVALRKESVDRNYAQAQLVNGVQVALRKESVDRNAGYRRGLRGNL